MVLLLRCLVIAMAFFRWQPAIRAADAVPPAVRQDLWTNHALLGSPEPPSPYVVERVYPKLEVKGAMYIAPEPGSDRLWVVLQGGDKDKPSRIVQFTNHADAERTNVVFELDRRLIYGLTFHPGFGTNRFVYLFSNGPWGETDRSNRISRWLVGPGPAPRIDPASEKTIIEWKSAGHDGGDLAFGRDGMLYITSGDGTSDSDGWDSGQDVSNLLATLIRIDVEHPDPGRAYSVPSDNPFRNLPNARPEIWAYGFRNPWRMSIDWDSGDIWVGNNGQDLWETAYLVRRGDNFGWSVMEGSHPFYSNRRRGPTPITPPTIEHHHAVFRSLTGGVVYRGARHPKLDGTYIYGDYATGKIWGARHRDGKLTWNEELTDTTLQITGFRVDQKGDLLVVDHGGGIYRLLERPPGGVRPKFPGRLSETGLFASTRDHRPHPGLIPYEVNAPGWADGASSRRWMALDGVSQIQYAESRGWNFPNNAVLVQTLSLGSGQGMERRVETRIMVRQDNEWTGYSYRWDASQADAELVAGEGQDIQVDVGGGRRQAWHIPSRTECLACHSRAVNFVLGLSAAQMHREISVAGQPVNQPRHLRALGVLSGAGDDQLAKAEPLVNPYDEHADLERRARSYLHANCSVCHVEAGGGNSQIMLEFNRERAKMNLVEARPQHDTFGVVNAMLVAPGQPERSVLFQRLSRRGRGQMPPIVISQVDQGAVTLFRNWISQLKSDATFVREWKEADFSADLAGLGEGRSLEGGRASFQKVGCSQCHRLGLDGGSVGPDLHGVAQRLSRTQLLESILEPSKTIVEGYATMEIRLRNGEVVTGQIDRETADEIILRAGSGVEDAVRIRKNDVLGRATLPVSNMPAGIVNTLRREEVLDLLAYLLADGKTGPSAAK